MFSQIHQFKMQFKIITSVLLFFVAQTMATHNPQRPGSQCYTSKTISSCNILPFMIFNGTFRGYCRNYSKLILVLVFLPKLELTICYIET